MGCVSVRRTAVKLLPDASSVVGRPHIPGDDRFVEGQPRLAGLVERIMQIPDEDVAGLLAAVRLRFQGRHRDLDRMLALNARPVEPLIVGVDDERRLLIGAYLTQEYAFQSSAVTNPSMVAAPDQTGVDAGDRRFVMSLRTIGEGHISSIAFRTGTVAGDGSVAMDAPTPFVETGERAEAVYERRHFADKLRELGADVSLVARVLDRLPRHFGSGALDEALHVLDADPPAVTHETTKFMRWLAASNYMLRFDAATTAIPERLIWPVGPFESKGVEDARFVRFIQEDGSTTYYATYTAYDGFQILPQLIETNDFTVFEVSTLSGRSARNKGMALFPRLIDGNYVALSRPDRENLHVVRSSDPRRWDQPSSPLRRPRHPWELIQMGNCGSPIETDAGWLVLTHGVGPMRTYRMGAMLLDLDDPQQIVGDLADPILEATEEERDGYVPNVVYSCGAMRHEDHLVVPYGAADQRTNVAVYSVDELVGALVDAGRSAAH